MVVVGCMVALHTLESNFSATINLTETDYDAPDSFKLHTGPQLKTVCKYINIHVACGAGFSKITY